MKTQGNIIASLARRFATAVALCCAVGGVAMAQTTEPTTQAVPSESTPPPRTWVDPDTGHRIHRLTDEPDSCNFYFNFNACTPDGQEMVYTSPAGIHLLNFATRKTKLLLPAPAHAIVVGHKTRTLYYTLPEDGSLRAIDLDTGASRKLADMPRRGKAVTVNADETLLAGTFIEGDGDDYGDKAIYPPGMKPGPLVQPINKGKMMEDRLAAKLPMVLFTIDLRTGERRDILHATDWLNHLLFSPTDPTTLMYCHEGPWHKIDRIWTIKTDGSEKTLRHPRTMAMEIAGHEFWGADGKTVWYDLQRPKGESFFLSSVNLETGVRRWYRLERDEWSVHFNVLPDESLICGDGGDKGQVARADNGKWIYLYRPVLYENKGIADPAFILPGVLKSERLVNMANHNYKLEPNVRFSPDGKMVIFSSNAFGPSYVFGVEIEKETAAAR